MRLGLILSNDWELYGDGRGDYFELQDRPLLELLDVAGRHGAPITLMAEVGQQLAHRRLGEAWSDRIANAWEDRLREVVSRGSDVQLHLHPQWLRARFTDGSWELNADEYFTSDLPPNELEDVIREARAYLEKLLRPHAPNYRCTAFRAGGYLIEPSQHVVPALQRAGIRCDSSVIPRFRLENGFDYRQVPSSALAWETSGTSVMRNGINGEGLLEIPVATFDVIDFPRLKRSLPGILYEALRFRARVTRADRQWRAERVKGRVRGRVNQGVPERLVGKRTRGTRRHRRWNALRRTAIRLDYDDLAPEVFARGLERIAESEEFAPFRNDDRTIPVMAIGHTKLVPNYDNLDRALEAAHRRLGDRLAFWTLRDAIADWDQRSERTP